LTQTKRVIKYYERLSLIIKVRFLLLIIEGTTSLKIKQQKL